jgi:hypothetical protein
MSCNIFEKTKLNIMKLTFTSVTLSLLGMAIGLSVSAQTTGDYRTKSPLSGAIWNNAASWQVYDSDLPGWKDAVTPPTSADGVITIRTGDSLVLGIATTIDQVVIESGASLNVYIPIGNPATTFTVANGAGDDIVVNGRLYVSEIGTTLSGAGTILVNAGGTLTLRGNSKLGVTTVSNGLVEVGSATGGVYITGSGISLTNNNMMTWSSGTNANIALQDGGSLINNGTLVHNQGTTTNTNIYALGSGTKLFVNTGTFIKNTSGTLSIPSNLNNSGTIKGVGTITTSGASIINTGTIAPGSSPGLLTVSPSLLGANTGTVEIEITGSGTTAGTDYDRLTLSNNTDLTNTLLNVIDDNSTTPVGTVYTIMTTTGTFSGGAAFIAANTLPSNFGNLTVNTNTVTIEKLAILPVKWGNDLTPLARGNKVELSWSTLQEVNTASFIIEHSTDGSHFSSIGQLPAKGNSNVTASYVFWHNTPDLNKINFYRVKQVDLDGKATYSAIRSVKFTKGKASAVSSFPNPVQNEMILTVQEKGLTITLNNLNGVEVRRWRLEPGAYPINLQELSRGMYQLNVYDNNKRRIDGQKILKL